MASPITVPTRKTEIVSACILEVEVGTNGYHGGDTGHGSRTYLRLEDAGGADIRVRPLDDAISNGGVEIVMGGDAELYVLIEALEFAASTLRALSDRPDADAGASADTDDDADAYRDPEAVVEGKRLVE